MKRHTGQCAKCLVWSSVGSLLTVYRGFVIIMQPTKTAGDKLGHEFGVVSNTVHFLGCLQCTLSVARRVICISQQAPAEIGDTYTFSFETVYACLLYTRYRCKKLKTPHKNVEAITDFSSIMLYSTVLYGTVPVLFNQTQTATVSIFKRYLSLEDHHTV
jgi:hypothetical protein